MIEFFSSSGNGNGAGKEPDSEILAEVARRLDNNVCQVRSAAAIGRALRKGLADASEGTPSTGDIERWYWLARCVSEVLDRIVVDFYPSERKPRE